LSHLLLNDCGNPWKFQIPKNHAAKKKQLDNSENS
jgi:hypothetical protein